MWAKRIKAAVQQFSECCLPALAAVSVLWESAAAATAAAQGAGPPSQAHGNDDVLHRQRRQQQHRSIQGGLAPKPQTYLSLLSLPSPECSLCEKAAPAALPDPPGPSHPSRMSSSLASPSFPPRPTHLRRQGEEVVQLAPDAHQLGEEGGVQVLACGEERRRGEERMEGASGYAGWAPGWAALGHVAGNRAAAPNPHPK